MEGFFKKSELLAMGRKPPSKIARCELCKLYKGCISPKMPPTGTGEKGILIVAEAPGAKEDEQNTQLIGKAGQKLREVLSSIKIDLDEDCIKTNAIICRPPKNRTPTDEELSYCRPHLTQTIEQYQPYVIIPMGLAAVKQVLDPYWDLEFGGMERWVGWTIPLQPLNTWICPTWHPSYIERDKNEVRELWFKRHLEQACSLTSKPWKKVPDYDSQVEQVELAKPIIEEMDFYDGMSCIDYECNTLKPDGDEAVCVSASITWGRTKPERCIAYAMTPKNREATRRYLRSPIPKIAANMKFEERWSVQHFGTRVRNWFWDTMECAHVLDNRPGITSLDFQALVRLGLPTYSSHIKPLLKAKKGLTVNQILSEVSMKQLLKYNGLDTITEFEIAVQQMKELGQKPPWRNT